MASLNSVMSSERHLRWELSMVSPEFLSPEFRCDEFRSAVRVFAPNPKHPNRQTAAEALPLTAERMSATVRRNLDWHSGMPRLWPASVNEGVRPRGKDLEFLKEVRK